jgi:hypothetical protein
MSQILTRRTLAMVANLKEKAIQYSNVRRKGGFFVESDFVIILLVHIVGVLERQPKSM